jgi:hypothetical protein
MPQGLQLLTFSKVAISGSAFEAVSPISGDSATFYNVPQGTKMQVAEIWGTDNLHACEFSVTATRWHDQTYGIRGQVTSGAATAPINRAQCLSPIGVDQPIFPSDVLTVQVNGTASDDVILTLLVYYPELPGISARLATYDYVKSHTKNLVGINCNLTPGDGVPGTAVALNASDNRLHANTDYALLGWSSTLAFGSLTVQGIDTGNLRVGGPVLGDPGHDNNMFVDYSRAYGGAALIPVINSNNAGSTNLMGVGTDVGAVGLDVLLAELDGPFVG